MSLADHDAVRSAFEAVGPDLLAYFERRVMPREDAADLLAETFTTAWRRIDDFPLGTEDRRRWLFGVALRTLANHRRGTSRRIGLADRLRARLTADPAPDPAESHAIRDAVNRLPEVERELVRLMHWEGFTNVQAAELLGINASTARSRYAAARRTLRTALLSTQGEGPASQASNAASVH